MISTPVRVVSVTDGIAEVEATAQSGCGGCASREACGVSGLGKYFARGRKSVAVRCGAEVRAGDELQLSLREGDLVKAGLLAYLLPSVLALTGAGIAAQWGDAAAVLGAAAGAAAGWMLVRRSGWTPRVVMRTDTNQGERNE